ncbi:hypothetical protein McanMca71_005017 [Microsporum canis]|uniref:Major facilitator superfamily (MFS) profile domain-containing protein n=1 Tax=Arthroderma otae (strain ATCC MYA-4605 / CBS 113480) TaxID=554155 RepID=C5FWE3_ARTOC|nr:conserved hypothetical protein [Microsporum canis CBS 113480]EEQ34227.1 conserved hypothetical protein [Microsporum canis CBS 113480]
MAGVSSSGDPEKRHDALSEETITKSAQESEWHCRAVLTLIGTTCILFCTVGFVNAFGVFEEFYSKTFFHDKSLSEISWFGSFNVFCMFSGALVTGILSDLYGPTWLLRGGTVMALLGIFMTSLCREYYQFFLAQGLLFGLGVAGLFLPSYATTSLYFVKHRALALGITVGGSSIGGVVWPIALRRLLVEVGFPWTMRIAGFIMMPLLVIGCLTVRLPQKKREKKPKPNIKAMKTLAFGLLAAALFFASMGLFVPFYFITSYSIHLGKDPETSFYLISVTNATSLFGRLLPGFWADRYGKFNTLILATLFSGIICCCITAATSLGGLMVIAAAYGFASGAIISIQGACATQLVDPATYGAAMGAVLGVCSIASLIGSPIAGELATRHGFLSATEYGGASLLAGSACLVASRALQSTQLFKAV